MFKHDEVSVPELSTKNINRKRFYQTPEGKLYPSITTVLQKRKMAGLMEWRKSVGDDVANYIARTAAHRGTKVHHMCEDFLNNNFDEEVHKKNFLPYVLFGQLKPVLMQKVNNILAQECSLYTDKYKVQEESIVLQNTMVSNLLLISKLQEKNAMMSGTNPTTFRHLHMQKCLKNELELKSTRL